MSTEPAGQSGESRRDILDRIAREAPPQTPDTDHPRHAEGVAAPSPDRRDRDTAGYTSASDPLITLVCAGLFLYVGFSISFAQPQSEPMVAFVGAVFPWLARIVGFGLLLIAGLEFVGMTFARPLSFVIALIATLSCFGGGLVWIFHQYSDGWLYLLFGLLNGSAARSAYFAWKGR